MKANTGSNDLATLVWVVLASTFIYAHWVLILRLCNLAILAASSVPVALVAVWTTKQAVDHHQRRAAKPAGSNSAAGIQFERRVADLLKDQGFTHIRLTGHNDLGIDIIARKGEHRWGIQVKYSRSPVGVAAVQQAASGLKAYRCDRAMVVTNSSYSQSACQLAYFNGCVLIGRVELDRWIMGPSKNS